MSDDERTEETAVAEPEPEPEAPAVEEEPAPVVESKPHVDKPKPQIHHDEDHPGFNEAQQRMEEDKIRRQAKMEEEMKEYEEMRKEERERLQQEIQSLRERREQRKKEREEEEKRLAELRAVEEQKRRAEEEERQRRKREEEAKRKEERERRKQEAEERAKSMGRPNFIISKKSGSEAGTIGEESGKEGKTKEQLEAEKKEALQKRIQPLQIDGFSQDQLIEKAKELFNRTYSLEGDKYDLEQRYKTQNIDMVELQERARHIQKGGGKQNAKVCTAPDPLADKISGIPPKVIMYSQYERVKDPRSFDDRKDLYAGPLYGIEYERIAPQSKVVLTEAGPRVIGEYSEEAAPAESAAPPQEVAVAEE